MKTPIEIQFDPVDPARLEPIVGRARIERLLSAATALGRALDGRAVVNVNSTSAGGGVAEMLHPLPGYARAMGIDTRWIVIRDDASFFEVTKRIHDGTSNNSGPARATCSPLTAS